MSAPGSALVIIGKIGAPYGVKGWLKVFVYAEEPTNLIHYQPWQVGEGKNFKICSPEDCKPHGKGLVAKFKGFDTPETARTLTGKEIAIERSQLAKLPPNEYYWTELEGLAVIDQKGQCLGHIAYLIETGSNDVFVIKDANGKEHALPYLPGTVVKEVNIAEGLLRVDWDLI